MATVSFRIKGVEESAGIKIRFKQGDQFDYELSTGLKVNRKHWSNKQQQVKNIIDATYKDSVNKKLNELRAFLMNAYYDACTNNSTITQQWLRDKVNICLNNNHGSDNESNVYFTPFIEKFIERSKKAKNKKTGKPLSEITIHSYHTTLFKLKEFENKYRLKLKISDIGLNFHSRFEKFLSEDQMLNPNTIGGYFSKIKLFCSNAEIQGIDINKELKSKNFYSPQNSTNDVYLNTDEIDLIFNYTFESKRLENARDWLIIGVWTGLRVSDLLQLTSENVKGDYIYKKTYKTQTDVIIPIHPQVKKILDKNDSSFPYKISDQKFNNYIKEVCKKVGLINLISGSKKVAIEHKGKKIYRKQLGNYPKYQLVSSHICRRSFATNFYGKTDTLTIMKITGHKTEKQFLDYIKTTSMEYAEKLKSIPMFQVS